MHVVGIPRPQASVSGTFPFSSPCVASSHVRRSHPGGKFTTTTNTPGCVSSGLIGMVSTHRVNDPHKCTCVVDHVVASAEGQRTSTRLRSQVKEQDTRT